MRRTLISGSSPYEGVAGSRAPSSRATGSTSPDGADPGRRLAAAGGRLRAGAALPRDHRRGARARRLLARARRADEHLRHRPRALGGGRAGARRGVRETSAPRRPASSPRSSTRPGRWRSRRRRCSREADRPAVDHGCRRGAGRPASSTTSSGERPVHARRRGGVHAPRPGELRPRPAHRHGARRDRGHELEPPINPELMQSVLEIATPVCRTAGDVMRRADDAPRLRRATSRAARGCASARPARTRSASSSASASRRRTATTRSSTSSSTSRGAS